MQAGSTPLTYPMATMYTKPVGKLASRLLSQLITMEKLANLDSVHFVGFSLGAHVVGYAGNYLRGKVARVTGLDPAGEWEGTF